MRIVWDMTFIFMVLLSFYAIPLLINDVTYDITTIGYPVINISTVVGIHVTDSEMFYEITISLISSLIL